MVGFFKLDVIFLKPNFLGLDTHLSATIHSLPNNPLFKYQTAQA